MFYCLFACCCWNFLLPLSTITLLILFTVKIFMLSYLLFQCGRVAEVHFTLVNMQLKLKFSLQAERVNNNAITWSMISIEWEWGEICSQKLLNQKRKYNFSIMQKNLWNRCIPRIDNRDMSAVDADKIVWKCEKIFSAAKVAHLSLSSSSSSPPR